MGLIRRSYTYLDKISFCYLFDPIVKPHLKYWVSIWYLLLKKNEELTENVLCCASELIPGILNLLYADRLLAINIPSMKHCWFIYDMIQVYKILHNEDESLKALFEVDSTSITRGHKFKIKKPFARNKVCKHFFSICVINYWNSYPPDVVNTV